MARDTEATPSSPASVRDYYDRILPFLDEELAGRGDEELWTRAAAEPPGCRVLELGAGTGRATEFLLRQAGSVVALDLSPQLLAVAHRRLGGHPRVSLVAADMRELHLRRRFDLVAAVDDPFVHLTEDADRDRALAAAAAHLAPDGRFLLDAAWLPPERRRAAGLPRGLVMEHTPADSGLEVTETWECDPATRLCRTRFEYRQDGREVAAASFPARLWSVEELEERAARAGLALSKLWGDYDQRSWERGSSPRLIAEMRPSL